MPDNSYQTSAPSASSPSLPPIATEATALPQGLCLRTDGIYVDINAPASDESLKKSVNELFSSGCFLHELNYETLIKLLYYFDEFKLQHIDTGLVRIATAVKPFSAERYALYRAVKIEKDRAEYYFEPVFINRPGSNSLEPARLDFDEFVAYLWEKGVRYGVDEAAVRAAIRNNKAVRQIVAQEKPVINGVDAGIQELAAEIHRSDAPREKSNGRLDLAQFKNRFPQVRKGVRLLKKVPRSHGTAGISVSGERIDAAPSKDSDLSTLIGPGTELINTPEGEFIVSIEDGFLNLDPETNKISIGKKIVNHDGVSGRTTGNLRLKAGDFEEFGEVQEKRIVEGHNITIHGVVFGNIISKGGEINLLNNLMGGSVLNHKGDIHLHGTAASAVVQVMDGEAVIQRAEGCLLVGKKLRINYASNCEILADEVDITHAEGCLIAAKVMRITDATPRKQTEMRLLVMLPDTSQLDKAVKILKNKIIEEEQQIRNKQSEAAAIPEHPDVKKYITIATKVKNKEITLNPEQLAAVQKLGQKVAPDLKLAAKLDAEIKDLQASIASITTQIEDAEKAKLELQNATLCDIDNLRGPAQMRSLYFIPESDADFLQSATNIKAKLRSAASNGQLLANLPDGAVHWRHDQLPN